MPAFEDRRRRRSYLSLASAASDQLDGNDDNDRLSGGEDNDRLFGEKRRWRRLTE
jgi:hypothetical protein